MTHRFTVSCALLTLMSVVACGSDSENGGSSGTGGTAPGSTGGDTAASGGDTAASGGDTSTTGGAPGTGGVVQGGGGMDGTGGGGPGPVSICPPGSESLTLEPGDVSAGTPIATPPDLGSDGQHVNLEGPVWIDGALYTSQLAFNGPGRILKYTPGGSLEVFIANSGTNGLAVDGDGTLYAARQTNGSVSTFDIGNPAAPPTVVVDQYEGAYFKSPNDLAIRSDGVLYFSDPDWQEAGNTQSPRQDVERAYWVDLQGTVHPIDSAPGKPNGIILSADESKLYIGGNTVMRFDVAADGSVSNGQPFGTGGSDGFGMDCAGNLYTTSGEHVLVFSPEGTEIKRIQVGSGVTNVAFGGPERKTLYITQMQLPRLYSVELNVPGFPY